MKLSIKDVSEITSGVEYITQEDNAFRFYRFKKEEEELYSKSPFLSKTYATPGVRMWFKTDAEKLILKINALMITSREYFSFEIFENGKLIGVIKNFGNSLPNGEYPSMSFEIGAFSGEFALGKGEKEIKIVFPTLIPCAIEEIELCGATFIKPMKQPKKLLIYGDSITQGYDSLSPSVIYSSKLAEALEAEEFNKAIGGEIYFPELAEIQPSFTPDYLVVAYGTNDWRTCTKETFKDNCRRFWEAACRNCPSAKKFALTPIWRKEDSESQFGKFCEVEAAMKEVLAEFSDVHIISCIDFVPHEEDLFADLRLHPNERGFEIYSKNIIREVLNKI